MFGRRTINSAVATPPQAGLPKGKNSDEADDLVQPLWSPTQAKARKSVETLLLERNQINEDQLAQARAVSA
jgi:hypothetical protein